MKNIFLLPTDQPSRLFKFANELHLDTIPKDYYKKYNINITSDEEIKDGDYWIYICPINGIDYGDNNKPIVKSNLHKTWFEKLHDKQNYKKIILTTDPKIIEDGVQSIDDEFLEWFVKNSSCEFVEAKLTLNAIFGYNYKIIIPQEEPKQETLEEAAANYAKISSSAVFQELHAEDFIAGAKWQRMYSEQDMAEAFIACWKANVSDGIECKVSFNEWFEQFKKK